MPLLCSRPRRPAAIALAALLLAAGPGRTQEKAAPTAKDVVERVGSKDGLAKLRERLAADPVGSRFRVDAVGEANGAVKVDGVMLVPGDNNPNRAPVEA